MVKLNQKNKVLTKNEWQKQMEEGKKPKNVQVTINLQYRDETCQHCKKKFRAGDKCDGYMDFRIIGFSGVDQTRHGYFCNQCMEEFVYRFMGYSSLLDFNRCPYKTYSWDIVRDPHMNKNKKPSGMGIKGKHMKYNKKVFEREIKKFMRWVKKNEPWNIVDYADFSGFIRR